MNSIVIRNGAFPLGIPDHAQVGDKINLTISATISKIEADIVDVTDFRSPIQQVLLGEKTTTMIIDSIAKPA